MLKLTDKEIKKLSTKEEIYAEFQWKRLQHLAKLGYGFTETEMLEASQVCSILVARNKRLKLI